MEHIEKSSHSGFGKTDFMLLCDKLAAMKTFLFLTMISTITLQARSAETIYLTNGCPNCHGFYGQGTSSGPRLQNKKEALLLRRLKDLQRGITRTAEGTVMLSFARSLDANQTRAMAHYLSTIQTSYENRDEYDYDADDFGDS